MAGALTVFQRAIALSVSGLALLALGFIASRTPRAPSDGAGHGFNTVRVDSDAVSTQPAKPSVFGLDRPSGERQIGSSPPHGRFGFNVAPLPFDSAPSLSRERRFGGIASPGDWRELLIGHPPTRSRPEPVRTLHSPGGAAAAGDSLSEPWVCFAPQAEGTGALEAHGVPAGFYGDPGSASALRAAAFQLERRWTRTASNPTGVSLDGQSITLTWSIVPEGTPVSGSRRVPAGPSNLRPFLSSSIGSEDVWMPLMQQVFDQWASSAGLRFVFEPNDDGAPLPSSPGALGVRGDIRISARPFFDGVSTIAVNYFPNAGDMVMNSESAWIQNPSSNWVGFRNVFAHEIGHGLGLAHCCPIERRKVMEPFATRAIDGPQFDDIYSAQTLYGDAWEDPDQDTVSERNDTVATAIDLGVRELEIPHRFDNLSLDSGSDVDHYGFRVPNALGAQISISARPIGRPYFEGPQSPNGDCPDGTPFEPRLQQRLAVELLGLGGTALTSQNAPDVGVAVNIYDFDLPQDTTGPFTIRVSGTGGSNPQLYDFEFALTPDIDSSLLFTVNEPSAVEGRSVSFFVQLEGPADEDTRINYRFEHDDTAPEDFVTPDPGALVFPAGVTGRALRIPTVDDPNKERDERFNLVFSNDAGITVARGTVLDNDPFPELRFIPVGVREDDGSAVIEIALSEISGLDLQAMYTVTPGSATPGADYQPRSGTLQVNAGLTTGVVVVPLTDDDMAEGPETFTVELSEPVFATIAEPGFAIVTINDDDTAGLLSGPGAVRITTLPDGAGVQIGWRALAGLRYAVEFTEDLETWLPLPGAESITAQDASPTHLDPPPLSPARQYRVRELRRP